MPTIEPADQYSPEPNTLEIRAGEYLSGLAPEASAAARELEADEVDRLHAVRRWGVGWAAGAGVLSGALIGGLEIFVRQELMNGEEGLDWGAQALYWGGFFAVAGVISAVEIGFLYWNALRAVGRVSRLARVGLSGDGYRALVARGLARSALEFPNPGTHVFGVDPYARVAPWLLTAKNLLYKTKVGVSSFILRVTLRRVLGRMAVRGVLPLLAAPLYAVWNAIITWRLLKAAQLRALAPLAVEDRVERLTREGNGLSQEARGAVVGGVAEMMRCAMDAHPNYVYLLGRLLESFGMNEEDADSDWEAHRETLGQLDEGERDAVLDALVVAALLTDKIRDSQKEFLEDAHTEAGLTFRAGEVSRLQARVMEGRRLTENELRSVRG